MAGKEAERKVSIPRATCDFAPREQKMKGKISEWKMRGRDADRRVEEGECEKERNSLNSICLKLGGDHQ